MHISGEGRQGREAVVILDTPGILEAEGREAAWGRERSEQHGLEVYSSRSDHLPEAPKCIRQKCTYLGVYSFLSDHLP